MNAIQQSDFPCLFEKPKKVVFDWYNLCRIKATDMESVYYILKKSVKSTIVQKITWQTQLYCLYIQSGIDHETHFLGGTRRVWNTRSQRRQSE